MVLTNVSNILDARYKYHHTDGYMLPVMLIVKQAGWEPPLDL